MSIGITTTHHSTRRRWDDEKREKRYRMKVESRLVCVGNSLATVRGWCSIWPAWDVQLLRYIQARFNGDWIPSDRCGSARGIFRWNPHWPLGVEYRMTDWNCAADFSVRSSKNADGQISLARCFGMLIDRWGVSPIWRAFRGLGFAFVSAMFVKEIDEGKKS